MDLPGVPQAAQAPSPSRPDTSDRNAQSPADLLVGKPGICHQQQQQLTMFRSQLRKAVRQRAPLVGQAQVVVEFGRFGPVGPVGTVESVVGHRVRWHQASTRGDDPHCLVPGRGHYPPRKCTGFAQSVQLLHQYQPYGLAHVIGIVAGQPKSTADAGDQRGVALVERFPRLAVTACSGRDQVGEKRLRGLGGVPRHDGHRCPFPIKPSRVVLGHRNDRNRSSTRSQHPLARQVVVKTSPC